MAKHLDETPGRKVPVWQQANRFYVEDVPSPLRTQSEQKPTKKSNNSYKPSKSTKRGDAVGAGEYAVSKGDSLWKIAQANGTTVEALKKANPEIKGNMIYPGQIINIGSKQNNASSNTNNTTNNSDRALTIEEYDRKYNYTGPDSTLTDSTQSIRNVQNANRLANTPALNEPFTRNNMDIVKRVIKGKTKGYIIKKIKPKTQNLPNLLLNKRRNFKDIVNDLQTNTNNRKIPNNYKNIKNIDRIFYNY